MRKLLVTALIVTVIGLFGACPEEATDTGGNGSEEGTGTAAPATPEAVFKALVEAGKAEDGRTIFDHLSKASQQAVAEDFPELQEKIAKMDQDQEAKGYVEMIAQVFGVTVDEMKGIQSPRDYCHFMMKAEEKFGRFAAQEFVSFTVDPENPNKGVVTYKVGEQEKKIGMIQEDGTWKLDIVGG